MKLNRNSMALILFVLQMGLISVVAGKWLFVSTHRFYLEDRTDDGTQGTAWQHFIAEKGAIVPQIITRTDARIMFPISATTSSVLHFGVRPTGPAAYQIYLLSNGERRLLLKDELSVPSSRSVLLPAGPATLELNNRGMVTWSDLRAVGKLHVFNELTALAVLFLIFCLIAPGIALPEILVRTSLMLISIVMTLLLVEAGFHLMSAKLPFAVVDARHDLGSFRLDPRWEFSARYKKRLRPNSDTLTQWNYGDLVQLAVIPAEASRPTLNRFPVRTDAEGFRNAAVRERIAVAALGDSFTDGLILPAEATWPARLEQLLGVPVQNYGIAGFGPQQEQYILQDYAIRHHPRVVVVAYFAGNDLFDAESFAKFEESHSEAAEIPGWKIKKVVLRYQTFYTYTLASMAVNGFWRPDLQSAGSALVPAGNGVQAAPTNSASATGPSFDRGMFHVAVNGSAMSFALMPSYLRTLNYSKEWLEARPGWALTRHAYQEIKRTAEQEGATVVVMYIPFKSQVFLPVLQRFFAPEDVNRHFRFYFRENQTDADIKTMMGNRLAQNEMMQALCRENGLLFLDLTPAIQRQIDLGNNVYFPDDAHWNAAGHDLAARELAAFLKERRLDRPAN